MLNGSNYFHITCVATKAWGYTGCSEMSSWTLLIPCNGYHCNDRYPKVQRGHSSIVGNIGWPKGNREIPLFPLLQSLRCQYIRQWNGRGLQQLWKVEIAPSRVYLTHDPARGLCLLHSSIADLLLCDVMLKTQMLIRWKKLFTKCIRGGVCHSFALKR